MKVVLLLKNIVNLTSALFHVILYNANKVLSFLFNLTRDSVVEILFEQDNEEKSVATLILDSLLQVFIVCLCCHGSSKKKC